MRQTDRQRETETETKREKANLRNNFKKTLAYERKNCPGNKITEIIGNKKKKKFDIKINVIHNCSCLWS